MKIEELRKKAFKIDLTKAPKELKEEILEIISEVNKGEFTPFSSETEEKIEKEINKYYEDNL